MSGCLHVRCSGTLDAETDQLIDLREMQGRLSMLENFQAGATFGKRLGRAADRIAIVDRMAEDPREGNLFFELVATNRLVYVKFFGNMDEARSWLSAVQGGIRGDSAAPF